MSELRKPGGKKVWLGLMIGNSRLHWGWFVGGDLICAWDCDYVSPAVIKQLAECKNLDVPCILSFPHLEASDFPIPLYLASVVPNQTAIWQNYPQVNLITLEKIPLSGLYPTLGIDRALALFGAGVAWGFPMLVIDAGTAMTYTAADNNQCLIGGAILPGLGLQLASLAEKTGQLPAVGSEILSSIPRFANNTEQAMQSGVIYTLLAGIKDFVEDWWKLFPEGNVAITGGDSILLFNYLKSVYPEIANDLMIEKNLIFWGMKAIRGYI